MEDSGLAPQTSEKGDRGSRPERLPLSKKGSRPTPQASKKGRRVPEQLKVAREGVENFIPWVSLISSRPPTREEEEEEEEEDKMADLVHNFAARKHKRGASFKRAIDTIPEMAGEASQQPSDETSEVQAIVVTNSPETGSHSQTASETTHLVDLGEVSPTSFHG